MLPNIIQDIERNLTIEQVLAHYGAKPSQTTGRYFCPFRRCQGDRRPHFVVDTTKRLDAYGRKIRRAEAEPRKGEQVWWRCDHSRTEGYGVVSLVAAILGLTTVKSRLTRQEWVKVLTECATISGRVHTELEDANRNGWLMTRPAQPMWAISLADGITPEAMTALSLDGLTSVPANDLVRLMHEQFGLWQVEKYTMAGCYPNGDRSSQDLFKSYERRAHALFPIFAFCYDWDNGKPIADNPEKRTDKWVARIVMPGFVREKGEDFDWRYDFWVVFNSEDQRTDLLDWNRRFALLADLTAFDTYTSRDAKASTSQEEFATLTLTKEEEQEVEQTNSKGEKNGKFKTEIVKIDLEPDEIRLNKCVLCRRPLDAVSTYLWLNYPRLHDEHPFGHERDYWHVAWLKQDSFVLNSFENVCLQRIAVDTYELFGNDRESIAMANQNALRYNYLRLCMLPTAMSEMDAVDGGLGCRHTPHTPLDFFRYYDLTDDELTRNMMTVGSTDGSKSLMLQKELNGSSQLRPFTEVKRNKRGANQKGYTYEVNLTAAWQMMANKGYCRSIQPGSRNTIGQCYRIDGHFVYELDPASVMADMRHSLEDYAKDNGTDPEDVEMMANAMLKCKDLQYDKNITKLPLMAMPRSESYGPSLDYFFFRNCALEITPSSITPRSYDDLDFLVYRTQVLPWDYQQPFYGRQPIDIRINPEYTRRQQQLTEAQRDGADSDRIWQLKQGLKDFAQVGQWLIDVQPTEQEDDRILVNKIIRNDTAHNQWLRWWPMMRLIRCFANEDWAREEAGHFTDGDRQTLTARMANLMFTIGRCIYRYHGDVQYMPFFLENTVSREGKAQGGSGKSMLLNNFLGFVRNILTVNGRDMGKTDDFANYFAGYVHHYHDVIHIEDFGKQAIDPFFVYASGDFEFRARYSDKSQISHEEAPMIVFSSNFVVQSTDESALGRIQFGGMSHYFSREVEVLNKEGRSLDTIVPDFECHPADCDPERRSQIIYTLAKCLQFCMVATSMKVKVAVPGTDLLERLSRSELGDKFYDWFTAFLDKDHIYNCPIAINEIFNEYKSYLDVAYANKDKVSRSKFYELMQLYCAKPAHGVLFMPIKPFLSASEVTRSRRRQEDGTEKSYLRKGASWVTRNFIDESGRVRRARVLSKNQGEDATITGGAVWFSRRGTEPKDEAEMLSLIAKYVAAPDPEPILDENDYPITAMQYAQWTMLNTEEEADTIRKAGGRARIVSPSGMTPVLASEMQGVGNQTLSFGSAPATDAVFGAPNIPTAPMTTANGEVIPDGDPFA